MTRRILAAATLACGCLLAVRPASAEILTERLLTGPLRLVLGSGTTRLDGMGLSLSAPDENNEINLFDYADNPAGLLDDRDAWSVDARWAHDERYERDPRTRGFDYKGNIYSFLGAVRRSGRQALAGGLDYVDARVRERETPTANFKQSQFRLLYNQQFGRLSAGVELRVQSESEDLSDSDAFYLIEHDTEALVGVAGLAYQAHDYVTIAGRGALRRATISGLSVDDAHEDNLDWERPSGSLDGEVLVAHPRVRGAVIYGRTEGSGEETVQAAWSPLFIFNPGNAYVRFDATTFTEEQTRDTFRTRWEVDVIPEFVEVSAVLNRDRQDYTNRSNPNVLGSLQGRVASLDQDEFGLGGNILLLHQRLFVGAEYRGGKQTLQDYDPLTGYTEKTTTAQFNTGAELILLENLAVRAGLGFRSTDYDDTVGETPDEDYVPRQTEPGSEQTLSVGAGLVPSGGILQLDAAYTVGIGSDYDVKQNHVSLYARLLF